MDLGNLASEEGRYMEETHDLIRKGAYSICGVEIPVLLVPNGAKVSQIQLLLCMTDLHPIILYKHFGIEHLKFKCLQCYPVVLN